jgi:predicted enzyme related to lactoylglutathione lyase
VPRIIELTIYDLRLTRKKTRNKPRLDKMKNHIVGLYTAIYHVADIARAKQWYSSLLGQQPYFDESFYVGFNVAGYELGLLPAADSKRKGCTAYWGVKNIEATASELQAKGHKFFENIADVGGGIKTATFLDADGNIIGLMENPHFPNK